MENKNRYDFMKEGNGRDPLTSAAYPDPLSINYNNLKITQKPHIEHMAESDIYMYLKKVNDIYGNIDYDDMVLTLNGYSHRNFLEVGDDIYFPSLEDMKNSFSKKGK